MQLSNIPVKFSTIWGEAAAAGTIRTVPVAPPGQLGAASFQTGFPSINFVQTASGGVPPFGQDFNGLANVMTAWLQWAQAGGAQPFDATFASEIGGYPQTAILPQAGGTGIWVSLIDNNSVDPDTAGPGTSWAQVGGNIAANSVPVNLTGSPAPPLPANLEAFLLSFMGQSGVLGSQELAFTLPVSIGGSVVNIEFRMGNYIHTFTVPEGPITVPLVNAFTTNTIGSIGIGINNSGSNLQDLWLQSVPNSYAAGHLVFYMQGISPAGGTHIDGVTYIAWGN